MRFLDKPYEDKSGSIKPTAMERTLVLIERSIGSAGERSSGAATSPVERELRPDRLAAPWIPREGYTQGVVGRFA